MDVAVILVGVDGWEAWTLPAMTSLFLREPAARVVVVDNGSTPAYPPDVSPTATFTRFPAPVSYPQAINAGIVTAVTADWLVVCNNDVLFHRPFCDRLAALDPARLYGFWTHTIFEQPYLSSWCLLISKTVLERVGMFDEAFAPMWFEDADYCIRAQAAGVPLVELNRTVWGIEHLAPDRKDERALFESAHGDAWKRNQAYLREKHGL